MGNAERKSRSKIKSMFAQEFPVLYHGTSVAALPEIAAQGLRPRGGGDKNNWKHTVGSNEQTVYLTDSYGIYFAFCAEPEKEGGAVLEIDTALLDSSLFVPDEDFLEQATRGQHIAHTPRWLSEEAASDMKRRTIWYREHAHQFPPEISLRGLGTVGYRGRIPYSAVKRTAIFDHDLLVEASFVFDPSITVMNYRVLGARYRNLMRNLFDPGPSAVLEEVDPSDLRARAQQFYNALPQQLLSRMPRIETNPCYGEES